MKLNISSCDVSDRAWRALRAVNERRGPGCPALTAGEMRALAETQREAVERAGRLELGAGALALLAEALSGSPYLDSGEYAQVLGEAVERFYLLRNELDGRLSDEELAQGMRALFDRDGGGLEGISPRRLLAPEGMPEPEAEEEEAQP